MAAKQTADGDMLVRIRDLEIDGITDETRVRIINKVDLDLKRGEVLGLIGESGAGKSTLGLAAMGFTRDGCEIVGGSVEFDGIDLVGATPDIRRQLLGKRIAYVAQSAAASFNPAHKIINQHSEAPLFMVWRAGVRPRRMPSSCIAGCAFPTRTRSGSAIRIRFLADSCSAR